MERDLVEPVSMNQMKRLTAGLNSRSGASLALVLVLLFSLVAVLPLFFSMAETGAKRATTLAAWVKMQTVIESGVQLAHTQRNEAKASFSTEIPLSGDASMSYHVLYECLASTPMASVTVIAYVEKNAPATYAGFDIVSLSVKLPRFSTDPLYPNAETASWTITYGGIP